MASSLSAKSTGSADGQRLLPAPLAVSAPSLPALPWPQQLFASDLEGAVDAIDHVLHLGFDHDVRLNALADELGAVGV